MVDTDGAGDQHVAGALLITQGTLHKLALYELNQYLRISPHGPTHTAQAQQAKAKDVAVVLGKRQLALDVTLTAYFGTRLPLLAEQVRQELAERLTLLTGLEVVEVNIDIGDVIRPEPGR